MTVRHFRIALAVCVLAVAGCERAASRADESTGSMAAAAPTDTARATASATDTGQRAPTAGASAPSAAAAGAADSTPGPIPVAFRGTWDASPKACNSPASEMRLRVDADTLHYYEGTGTVLRVVPIISDGGQIIRIETRHEAEGAVDQRTQTLARRGDSLWVKIGTDSTARVRCAGGR
jgi:hypothetical protein